MKITISNNSRRNRTPGMAAPLVTLHVAPHREGLSATSMGATEGLLACVAMRVDAKTGRPRESLVTGAANIPVMVLLVGGGVGRREVVVVLPGRSNRRDHLLVVSRSSSSSGRRWCRSSSCRSSHGLSRSLVVDGSRGSSGRGFNGRRVGCHTRGRRSVGARLSRTLAGDGRPFRSHWNLGLLVVVNLVAGG